MDNFLGLRLPPVYQDEKGDIFWRSNATNLCFDLHQVIGWQQQMINEKLAAIIARVEEEEEEEEGLGEEEEEEAEA